MGLLTTMVDENWAAAPAAQILIKALAIQFVQVAGVKRSEERAAECQRLADSPALPATFREANERHAAALRDAINVIKTQRALTGGSDGNV